MKLLSIFTFLAFVTFAQAAEPIAIKLWPDGAPGKTSPISEATQKLIDSNKPSPSRVTNVMDPEITVYKPENPNGACVIVAPGGGYYFLSWTNEGTQVCDWLNSIGVTAVLLKYRTPTRDDPNPFEKPSADALRAIGLVRHHAAEWGVDPKRVGILGFSAGGNLVGHVSCDRGERSYVVDPKLDDSRGPDFAVMVYGGGFLDKEDPSKFRSGFSVPTDAPPMFLIVAHDDKSNPVEMTRIYLEYKKLGIPAEIHIFASGGHGFGMKPGTQPANAWPQRCGEWMASMGYLKKP
ncbi:MAG: alpha/beta hydrolase [Proteobacteria bacterium]|nr:alpha/beta hydrolase [Pseudomonadota bacterium]